MEKRERRLLIVEDDLMILYALRSFFDQHGWDVDVARTVSMAMDSLDPPPDWLILDLCLPDGDGEEVLRRIRKAGMKTRVAIASGTLDPARVARLLPLGPELLMPKPIDFRRLFVVLDGSSSVSAEGFLKLAEAPTVEAK